MSLFRWLLSPFRREISNTSILKSRKVAGPADVLTGKAKKELQAILCGVDDPWNIGSRKRGPSTFCKPNLIPSAYDSRIVGCICHEDVNHISWMRLEKGPAKRCECGCWFKLVDHKPFYEGKEEE